MLPLHYPAKNFNPRAPYGARLAGQVYFRGSRPFQSTRPIRGATRRGRRGRRQGPISIHAPHTGRDGVALGQNLELVLFQSTRPIRGATPKVAAKVARFCAFQSTRPIRGATCLGNGRIHRQVNFNPRAPYGARQQRKRREKALQKFQSTRPIRGATRRRRAAPNTPGDFNPRAPYGARLAACIRFILICPFQSTRPIRGATIHDADALPTGEQFQSTRPIRGATWRPATGTHSL